MTTTTEGTAGAPAPDAAGALDELRRHAVRLAEEFPRPPRTLRVRAGDLLVEAEWDELREPAPDPARTVPAEAGQTAGEALCAETVGVFYLAPSPEAQPFVGAGDVVEPGQQVGIIEAMKLMIPVEADRSCRIVEVLKKNGEPVEYGEPLFALAPAA
ncbi:acetyl-CoA carboxylase biotin carboxyl carrier protein [Streptomyces sp. NPDC059002]|uniref:acetyl-CoA carboxylase biotin carboxyl carrier protein n=1 Tax=Streptomyces sp. NPDC059002 TaxID=3346690 RepID=UPI00368FEFA1